MSTTCQQDNSDCEHKIYECTIQQEAQAYRNVQLKKPPRHRAANAVQYDVAIPNAATDSMLVTLDITINHWKHNQPSPICKHACRTDVSCATDVMVQAAIANQPYREAVQDVPGCSSCT